MIAVGRSGSFFLPYELKKLGISTLSSDHSSIGLRIECGSIKFKDFVKPGDVMLVEVKIISVDDEKVKIKGHVKVDGKTKTVLSSAYLKYIDLLLFQILQRTLALNFSN